MGLRLWLWLFRVFYSPCALCCCFGWSTYVEPVGLAAWLDDDYDDGVGILPFLLIVRR
jgi:hypothetical protein